MKKGIVSMLLLVSVVSHANPIQVGRNAHAVRVNSVQAVNVGGAGFPVTEITIQATFSNRCQVPQPTELVSIVNYSKNFDNLVISLGTEAHRACTTEFKPVTVAINLGRFTKPNDGHFSTITVNQVEAD